MRRVGVFLALCVGLTGCDELPAGFGGPTGSGHGVRTLSLLDGDVRVRGPQGYCVDQRSSRGRDGFALLAGCAILAEDAALIPTLNGLLTVQFGAPGTALVSGSESTLEAFLKTAAGRATLAEDGNPDKIAIGDTHHSANRVMVRFQDTGADAVPGTAGAVWRGFMDIDGRLVTVTVLNLERDALTGTEGKRLLAFAMDELARVNAAET